MLQEIITISIIAVVAIWVGYMIYRAFAPSKSGCGGDCHCGQKDSPAPAPSQDAAPEKPQTVFFSADDMVRRLKARR